MRDEMIQAILPYTQEDEYDAGKAIDLVLALFQKLVASKKNMPELMLSEYGKGQNDLVDDLLSEISK